MNTTKTILFLLPYALKNENDENKIIEYLHKRSRKIKTISLILALLTIASIFYYSWTDFNFSNNALSIVSLAFNTFLFIYLYKQNNFTEDEIKEALKVGK